MNNHASIVLAACDANHSLAPGAGRFAILNNGLTRRRLERYESLEINMRPNRAIVETGKVIEGYERETAPRAYLDCGENRNIF